MQPSLREEKEGKERTACEAEGKRGPEEKRLHRAVGGGMGRAEMAPVRGQRGDVVRSARGR